MKTNDLVSIIIPCYNQAQYLEEAVQSAVNQTYPYIEIIIVNDGSPDNTEEIAQSLKAKHPEKIRVISQKNSGVSKARNSGIKEASGQYILPLDADDKLDEKMISRCVEAMQQTNADIVHGGLQCFGERDDIWISKPFSENNILYENLPHGSSLYRKQVWEKIKGYKENMKEGYEDWEFWINAYKHNFIFHYLPKVLFHYRINKISRDTLAMKKDIYLKAKIMMNHPELYTINQVQKAIETIKNTEKLADLYFYYDENMPSDTKKWLIEIVHDINNKKLGEKQILEVFDQKIGLCNIDILEKHMSIQKLHDEMNVSFILFFSTIRYDVKILKNSDYAWDKDKGIVNTYGTLFPFVFKSKRENPELQDIAHQRLLKYPRKLSKNHMLYKNDKIMVSVCVMSYNLEKYIAQALDSILMQRVNFRYNIVIGEDCSTDKTREIIQEYIEKYPDTFKVILHPNNLGMLANFAATLKACEGKYIALLDGDDYWTDPLKLQKQVDFLESNKEYSMVFHNIELHDHTNNGVIVKPFNLEEKSREYTYDEILKTWSVGTCAVLCINNEQYRYIENNLWFPVQDIPFYLCCASMGKLYYMAETMSVYRRLPSGSQNSKEYTSPKIHLTFIKYFQKLYNDFSDLLSPATIDRVSASHYLFAAQKYRKNGNEKDYMKYLELAMVKDPQYIYEKEIKPTLINTDKKLHNLQHKYNLLMNSISNLIGVSAKSRPLQKISAYKSLTKTYFGLLNVGNEIESDNFKTTRKMNIEITPDEIIFLIPTCAKYSEKTEAVRSTWARQLTRFGFRYLFLMGKPELKQAKIENDILYVPCRDDYESLLLKLLLGYEFLYQNMNFTYVYKIDDDCFPDINKLVTEILPQLGSKQYLGGSIHPSDTKMSDNWHFGKCSNSNFHQPYKYNMAPFDFAKGGYGYFLHKDILPLLFDLKEEQKSDLEKYIYSPEDVWIAESLKKNGISVNSLENYTIISGSDYNKSEHYLVYDIQSPTLMKLIEKQKIEEEDALKNASQVEITEDKNNVYFSVHPKTKDKKVAFYLYKNNKHIDTQWYSKNMTFTLDKTIHHHSTYKVKYFLVHKNDTDPANSTEKEIGESEVLYIK